MLYKPSYSAGRSIIIQDFTQYYHQSARKVKMNTISTKYKE